jgi:hypothetical protein
MGSIFKNKTKEKGASVTNIRILEVLVTRLLKRELNRLVKEIEPMEL